MGVNVIIDEILVAEAKRITGLTSDAAAIEELLRRTTGIARRPLDGMLDLAGSNILRDDYDYKALRNGGGDEDRH